MMLSGYGRSRAGGGGDAYFDTFSTDTTSDYTLTNGGTLTYDSGNGEMDATGMGNFGGVSTAMFAVGDGGTYNIEVDLTNETGLFIDLEAGTVADSNAYGSIPSIDRVNATTTTPTTMTWTGFVVPGGVTSLKLNVLPRGTQTGALHISRIRMYAA